MPCSGCVVIKPSGLDTRTGCDMCSLGITSESVSIVGTTVEGGCLYRRGATFMFVAVSSIA